MRRRLGELTFTNGNGTLDPTTCQAKTAATREVITHWVRQNRCAHTGATDLTVLVRGGHQHREFARKVHGDRVEVRIQQPHQQRPRVERLACTQARFVGTLLTRARAKRGQISNTIVTAIAKRTAQRTANPKYTAPEQANREQRQRVRENAQIGEQGSGGKPIPRTAGHGLRFERRQHSARRVDDALHAQVGRRRAQPRAVFGGPDERIQTPRQKPTLGGTRGDGKNQPMHDNSATPAEEIGRRRTQNANGTIVGARQATHVAVKQDVSHGPKLLTNVDASVCACPAASK